MCFFLFFLVNEFSFLIKNTLSSDSDSLALETFSILQCVFTYCFMFEKKKKSRKTDYQQYCPQCITMSCKKSMFPESVRISLINNPQYVYLEQCSEMESRPHPRSDLIFR